MFPGQCRGLPDIYNFSPVVMFCMLNIVVHVSLLDSNYTLVENLESLDEQTASLQEKLKLTGDFDFQFED